MGAPAQQQCEDLRLHQCSSSGVVARRQALTGSCACWQSDASAAMLGPAQTADTPLHVCVLALAALYARQVLMHSSFRRDVPYASLSDPAATGAAAAAGMPGAAAAAGKREAPPTGPTEEVAAAAKRRRWDQQVQECMGSTNGVSTVCSSQVVDVVHMAWASPSALSLQSVDGSVLCRDDAGQVQGGGDARAAARRPGLSSLYTWAYACPITGQMWMPANV